MPIDSKQVGQRLVEAREAIGRSLSQIAEDSEIAKSYLLKLERGEVENPGLATLHRVTQSLGITLADVLEPITRPPQTPTWEQLAPTIPATLRTFLAELEEKQRVTADVKISLATLQFRGKRPESVEDWRFVYDAIQRSLPSS